MYTNDAHKSNRNIYINIFQHKEEKKPKDGCDYNDIETTTHTHS